MNYKKFIFLFFITFSMPLVFDQCSDNIAEAAQAQDNIATVKQKVKYQYGEFTTIVEKRPSKPAISKFFGKHFDTPSISKRFCGTKNDDLIDGLVGFLLWRLETEAIQAVKQYKLSDNMSVVNKGKTIIVNCRLTKPGADPVEMKVIFSKNPDGSVGKVMELVVVGIELINGAGVIMKKYFEEKNINIKKETPTKRAEYCVEALNKFIEEHKTEAVHG